MMKTKLLITTLLTSALLLSGCSNATVDTADLETAIPSTIEMETTSPESSEEIVTDISEISLSLGEQYRLGKVVAAADGPAYSASYTSDGVVVYVSSEDNTYEPFFIALSGGETLVYLTASGETSPSITFKITVEATEEEEDTFKEAAEIADSLAGLSEADARAKVSESDNSAISVRVVKIDSSNLDESDYDLGRINLYLDESGLVEYAGVG